MPDTPRGSAATAAYVWLVISTNGRVMSVLDNEAAAKHVAGDHWIVERWAVRHLVEVGDGSWLPSPTL